MKLSVIITAYDQHEVTTVHVRECMNNSRPPDEIVVVNDHGDLSLREMLIQLKNNNQDFKNTLLYAYINNDIEWNYTGARNLGVWLSSGNMLSMEDTDNIPSKDVYKNALEFMEKNHNIGKILYGGRPKVFKKDILSKSVDEWEFHGSRSSHRDTQMLRRDVYLKIKGCDERFAGKYAWACADWRRRLNRAGIEQEQIKDHFYTVIDGETESLVRRKSYRNYDLAREKDGHIQSPIGILNFTYTYEII